MKYTLTIILFGLALVLPQSISAYTAADFVTTWDTTNPGTSIATAITIPTIGAGYNFEIDWGDGATSSYVGSPGNITHNYATSGVKQVVITGAFPRIYFNQGGDGDKLLTIEQWGDTVWTTMNSAFAGADNLTIPATDAPDLSSVTDMYGMFFQASSFNQPLNNWDVSSVTNMANLFYRATSFNQPLNNWDVSNVTNMSGMFSRTDSFNQNIDGWNVSGVGDMDYIFNDATAFNQPLNSWDVSNLTSMNGVFTGATSFNQPLDNWDVSNVTSFGVEDEECTGMFCGATAFNQDISGWDVSNANEMGDMFADATAFDQDLSSWDVSNVTLFRTGAGLGIFNNSGLSTTNYTNILNAWSSLTVQNGRNFGTVPAQYCSTAQSSRDILTTTYSWTITDDGPVECVVESSSSSGGGTSVPRRIEKLLAEGRTEEAKALEEKNPSLLQNAKSAINVLTSTPEELEQLPPEEKKRIVDLLTQLITALLEILERLKGQISTI